MSAVEEDFGERKIAKIQLKQRPSTIHFTSEGAKATIEGPISLSHERALRRVQDLEIANTSLLNVNTNLEATVRHQAQIIEKLQKKLAKYENGKESDSDCVSNVGSSTSSTYNRLCGMLEQLVQDGMQAISMDDNLKSTLGSIIQADYWSKQSQLLNEELLDDETVTQDNNQQIEYLDDPYISPFATGVAKVNQVEKPSFTMPSHQCPSEISSLM
ncbi:hypothetical protein HK103_005820 [Boothiomyces macroporosus]|uniref:Uncharacterized protein n=1 Tax=Boothiomyces macroporosus TaxID=261099 RepID=A0AAD5UIH7_9FUNG|nr:hypothetical protein HK103_005820 [Boothiomyces macroporosus]